MMALVAMVIVTTLVGGRLLLVARRRRALPELLFGRQWGIEDETELFLPSGFDRMALFGPRTALESPIRQHPLAV
jgi:hypothetical protein